MRHRSLNQFALKGLTLALLSSLALTGCGGSGSGTDAEETPNLGLPEGLTLASVDASSPAYVSFDTETEAVVDLNEKAINSGDSAVQKMQISDTATIGHIFHWPDFRVVNEGEENEEEKTDMKYLLMNPDYTYQSGDEITHEHFVQLVHFHGDDLAAHSPDEFDSSQENWEGSNKQKGLARLNAFVAEQAELEDELAAVLPEGQSLCRAFVDPYIKFELEHEEEHEEEESESESEEHEGHDHGELVHFALTESGRIYFYEEHEGELELSQEGFVPLTDVTTIENCSRTTIMRASDEGIMVYVPDVQNLYLVDNHGADWHEHSYWEAEDIVPEGYSVDLMAILGEGAEHDHEDEDHDHDDE